MAHLTNLELAQGILIRLDNCSDYSKFQEEVINLFRNFDGDITPQLDFLSEFFYIGTLSAEEPSMNRLIHFMANLFNRYLQTLIVKIE